MDDRHSQVYLRQQLYEMKVKKRLHRLVKKARWVAYSRRYELYTAAIQHLSGELPEQETGQPVRPSKIPLMAGTDDEIGELTEELIQCFKLSGADKTDTQEFFYSVNKRFAAVFNSQSAAMGMEPATMD